MKREIIKQPSEGIGLNTVAALMVVIFPLVLNITAFCVLQQGGYVNCFVIVSLAILENAILFFVLLQKIIKSGSKLQKQVNANGEIEEVWI